jgi:hypothetical protein
MVTVFLGMTLQDKKVAVLVPGFANWKKEFPSSFS